MRVVVIVCTAGTFAPTAAMVVKICSVEIDVIVRAGRVRVEVNDNILVSIDVISKVIVEAGRIETVVEVMAGRVEIEVIVSVNDKMEVIVSVIDESTVVGSKLVSIEVIKEVRVDAGRVNVVTDVSSCVMKLERILVARMVISLVCVIAGNVVVISMVEKEVIVLASSVVVLAGNVMVLASSVIAGSVVVLAGSIDVNIDMIVCSLVTPGRDVVRIEVRVCSSVIVLAGRTEVMNDVNVPRFMRVLISVIELVIVVVST